MRKPDVSNSNREVAQKQVLDGESSSATQSSQPFHIVPNDRLLTQQEALHHIRSRRLLTRLVELRQILTVLSHGDSGRILYVESTVKERAEALKPFINRNCEEALTAFAA